MKWYIRVVLAIASAVSASFIMLRTGDGSLPEAPIPIGSFAEVQRVASPVKHYWLLGT